MNRFVWDLRYPDATGFPKLIMWSGSLRGPVAVPGNYQVRMTASGQTLTQAFAVTKNPNLSNVTDADLRDQFTLAMQIRDRLSQANATVVKIRALKDQVTDRLAKLGATPAGQGFSLANKKSSAAEKRLVAAGQDLLTKLTAVEGEIYQYRNQSSQDPLNFPVKLNDKLAGLEGVVESADARPTAAAAEVFKDLSARLDAEIAKLDGLLKTEVPALNKLTASRKLEPIKVP
jgi:hypothetical protein